MVKIFTARLRTALSLVISRFIIKLCQDDEAPQGNSGWQIYKIFDSLIT